MQERFVLIRGERIVLVFRPEDERFRFGDEASFLPASGTPANEFYRSVAAKMESAEGSYAMAITTDYVLNIPVHNPSSG
jgi:hypothetical protein